MLNARTLFKTSPLYRREISKLVGTIFGLLLAFFLTCTLSAACLSRNKLLPSWRVPVLHAGKLRLRDAFDVQGWASAEAHVLG
eukprot:3757616-Pleurochrysis_carterae.AAC.2